MAVGVREASGRVLRAIFGPDNPRAGRAPRLPVHAFDVWHDGDAIHETFDSVFSTALPGDDGYDPARSCCSGSTSVNLFEQCCHSSTASAAATEPSRLQQSLLLYAVLLHRIEKTEDFPRRVRILRNLLAASAEDEVRRPNMPGLLKDVEAVIVDGDLDVGKQAQQQPGARRAAKGQASSPHTRTSPERSSGSRTTRSCVARSAPSSSTADSFQQRAEAFEPAFADPATGWT